MRLVTYVNYCDEVGPGAYAANETTAVVTQKAFIGALKTTFVLKASPLKLVSFSNMYSGLNSSLAPVPS
jgi:hypothetical protein